MDTTQTGGDDVDDFDYNFEINIKQVTYPLLTLIISSNVWYNTILVNIKNNDTFNPIYESLLNIYRSNGITVDDNIPIDSEYYNPNSQNNMLIDDILFTPSKNIDIFTDSTICFHPLLPIYMITQAFITTINNENIYDSLDFELFVNYLNFLIQIKNSLINIYSGENNNKQNKLTAYMIGLGLKNLLFILNNTHNNSNYLTSSLCMFSLEYLS
jgi:hypothetical protein